MFCSSGPSGSRGGEEETAEGRCGRSNERILRIRRSLPPGSSPDTTAICSVVSHEGPSNNPSRTSPVLFLGGKAFTKHHHPLPGIYPQTFKIDMHLTRRTSHVTDTVSDSQMFQKKGSGSVVAHQSRM